MQKIKNNQIFTYQRRRKIRQDARPAKLEARHWNYLLSFLIEHKKAFGILLMLIVAQSILEIFTLFFINSSILDRVYAAVHTQSVIFLVTILTVGVSLYLFINYMSLRYERGLIIDLINDLRRKLFSAVMRKEEKFLTNEAKADFLAKISYHLPLLSMGVDRGIFGIIRWFLSFCVLITIGLTIGSEQIVIVVIVVLTSFVIGAVAYFIAYYYVSREVASFSLVIRHIALTLSEHETIKSTNIEKSTIEELDRRVEIDSYFRLRRDIWLRYFNRVILAVIFFIVILYFILALSFFDMSTFLYDPSATIVIGIITVYALRLFYESGLVGLYLPPLKLGIFLSVPRNPHKEIQNVLSDNWKEITFKSNKVKLSLGGIYFKKIAVTLKRGERYLFFGKPDVGKTSLASIFNLVPYFNSNAWLVVVDEKRYSLKKYSEKFKDHFFFTPHFESEKTIGEIVFRKEKKDITQVDVAKAEMILQKYPPFDSILSAGKRFIGDSTRSFKSNDVALFKLQVLYCIVNNTSFIIIDNHWIDLEYSEIKEMLIILGEALPNATIISFSRDRNEIIKYNTVYEIKEGLIESI